MTLTFSEIIPAHIRPTASLISGQDSKALPKSVYLLAEDDYQQISAFEIRYEYHCSPFQQAEIVGDLLLVGHEEHFYLYDLVACQNVLALKMDGYFAISICEKAPFT